ncbi:MAG: hypothetical protein KGL75_00730 [Acidobacteriota bacterium]|nr:hypothetical protein [Acidobacteriota bacterium]
MHERKQIERAEARLGREILLARPNFATREAERTIEDQGIERGLGNVREIGEARFSGAIPVLERGFEIAFEEIDRA